MKQALQKQQNIYIVEGEKDVETLRKLGLVATTIYSKKWQDIYNEQLQGAKVVFIGDTGEAGEQYKELMMAKFEKNSEVFQNCNSSGIRAIRRKQRCYRLVRIRAYKK